MKNTILLALVSISSLALTEAPNYWETLSKVIYSPVLGKNEAVTKYTYKFHPKIRKLIGKKIQLKGFLWQELGKPLTLCKFSYPANLHCNLYTNISSESYVELRLEKSLIYDFSKPYVVEGFFYLEEKDSNDIFYKLNVSKVSLLPTEE